MSYGKRSRVWTTFGELAWASCARRAVVVGSLFFGEPAAGEQLHDALRYVYEHSPIVTGAVSNVVASGEDVTEAAAPGRPQLTSVTSHVETLKQAVPSVLLPNRTFRSELTATVPIYRSGAVKYAVRDAETRYDASRESYRAAIGELFGSVVAAFNDVLRDEAAVRLNEQNTIVLEQNLKAARGRFRIGDVTVTDVAQSEARLALAEGSLRAARSTLVGSQQEYVRLTGLPASGLTEPGDFAGLPVDGEEAVRIALANNGSLRAARLLATAAAYRIRAAEGERGPRISAFGSGGYFNYFDSVDAPAPFRPKEKGTSVQVGVTLEVPFYQGGLPASRVRRAAAERSSFDEQAASIEREVASRTRTAFASWVLAKDYEVQAMAAISADERAVRGAAAENQIGTRPLVDVLDAQRELLTSRLTLASVRRDMKVASFALLVAMGRADPGDLGIADGSASRMGGVRRTWSDWSDQSTVATSKH